MSGTINTFIVASFEPLRHGLRSALADASDIEVIGDAPNLATMVSDARYRKADVLVIDAGSLLGSNAPDREVYNQLDEWLPEMKVLFMGTADDAKAITPDDIPAYMRLSCLGFLLKDGPTSRIVDGVRLVYRGAFVCEIDVIRRILVRLTQWASYSPTNGGNGNVDNLSERESEVLAMVGHGMSNTEIAQELFLSEGTVKAHISHIMAKLSLDRRTELVRYAISKGLVSALDE